MSGGYIRLARLLTKQEHLLWAERVKPHLLHSVTVHNNLLQHGRGLVSHGTFYVLRDSPHSDTVLYRNEIAPAAQNIGVFCLKEEVGTVVDVLRSSAVIDWEAARRTNLVFQHVSPYAVEALESLAQEKGVKMRLIRSTVFTNEEAHLDTHTLRVPAGFRVCRLGRAGVRHLLEKAKFGGIPLDLMYRMAENVPYVGVYQDPTSTQEATVDPLNLLVAGDEEVPVAWCCTGPAGEMAKMVIDERFKRNGFGKLLVTTIAKRQAALLGFIPHGFVEADNSAPKSMANSLPGWRAMHECIWMASGQLII